MKITHLIFSFTTGGAETMLVDIANEQVKKEEVHIVIINNDYNEELISKVDKRVIVHRIDRKIGTRNPLPIIKLNHLLFKINSHILHCHDHNIAQLLLPLYRKRAVLTVHDVGIPIIYIKNYKKLFAISNSVKEDIKKRSKLNATLVYNGIYCENVSKKVISNSKDFLRFVIVSRLRHEKKGQHLAIKALYLLKEKGFNNILLDLIGAGPSEQFLKELTENYGLTEQINFLGLKSRDYIYAQLKNYDLLIQPSIYEGFGLTVAEAMAAKVPVLVSDNDGPMEIIVHGKYGFHFHSENAEDLANQLLFIIEQAPSIIQQQVVEPAYIYANKHFNIKQTAINYILSY